MGMFSKAPPHAPLGTQSGAPLLGVGLRRRTQGAGDKVVSDASWLGSWKEFHYSIFLHLMK
jgi:hypothetical protein